MAETAVIDEKKSGRASASGSIAHHRHMQSLSSIRDDWDCKVSPDITLSIVVLGASGDLAKKKTFPALFALYRQG